MKLPVRMIAVDMDGTLLDSQKKISKENIAALEELGATDIHLVICTGRHPDNARWVLEKYRMKYPVIGLNGSLILDTEGGIIAAHTFNNSGARKVAELLEKNSMDYLIFTLKYVVLREQIEGSYTAGPLRDYIHEISNGNYRLGPYETEKALEGDVYKIACFNRRDPLRIKKTRNDLQNIDYINVTKSAETNIEIMPEGIDKGSALREYAAFRNMPLKDVLAMGDQENDLPMLQSAGYSIAMANAGESVKAAVNFNTASNEESGVAKALWKYVL